MAKDSFLMYTEWGEQIAKLTDEQSGILIKNIFAYKTGGNAPEMDAMTEMCFSFLKSQIDRDSEKYDEICEKRREAGRKGGKANGIKSKQMQANANFVKHYDNDNEYEDDNDDDYDDDYDLSHESSSKTRLFEPRVKLRLKKPEEKQA